MGRRRNLLHSGLSSRDGERGKWLGRIAWFNIEEINKTRASLYIDNKKGGGKKGTMQLG